MFNDVKRVILTEKGRDTLRNLRITKGLPNNFSKNYSTIIKWENGKNNPTYDLFERYLNCFGITLEKFKETLLIKKIAPSIRDMAIHKTTKIPKEKHNSLINDYNSDLTLEKISKKYGCTPSNVFYILRRHNIDMTKHGSGENYHFPESNYISYLRKKGIVTKEILPLIASLLFTDGSLSNTKKTFEISYYGYDKTLHNIFADLVWYSFKIRPSSYMTRCGRVLRTKYIDKNFINKMLELSPSYKTKPAPKQDWTDFIREPNKPSLNFLKNYSLDILKEFVRLAMCADGCISVSRKPNKIFFTLILSCAHPSLSKGWANLLNKIGIKNNIVGGFGRTKIGGVKGVEDCLFRFHDIGGFIPGVKVCVRKSPLCGIEKQKILSSAVKILQQHNRLNTAPVTFENFKSLL